MIDHVPEAKLSVRIAIASRAPEAAALARRMVCGAAGNGESTITSPIGESRFPAYDRNQAHDQHHCLGQILLNVPGRARDKYVSAHRMNHAEHDEYAGKLPKKSDHVRLDRQRLYIDGAKKEPAAEHSKLQRQTFKQFMHGYQVRDLLRHRFGILLDRELRENSL